jgi:flagellar hook protein FlgE
MALFGALSTGRSGLTNSGAALSVIGNNIANVATTGFKGSRTEFADLISAEAGGDIGKIGLGSRIGAVRTLFTQGAIESTGRSLDLGIEGTGFFVLGDGQGQLYTRAGNFQLSADGTVTNLIGKPLLGAPLDVNGQPAGALTAVSVAGLSSQARATTTAGLVGNLRADDAVRTTAFDTATPSFANAFAASNFSTSVQVYDSLGGAHNLSVFFVKSGTTPNSWNVYMGVDAGETGGTPGDLQLINGTGGTLNFDTSGAVSGTPTGLSGTVQFSGAAAQTINLDLGAAGSSDRMTQTASASGINKQTQDGFGAGGLASLNVDSTGIVSATFDNGQTRALFQLAIAHFTAPEGLAPAGNQEYRATLSSGAAAIGVAGSQGNGTVVSSALEQSNVQIAQEFIDLISTQRSFQASARVITASDTLLSDLINIIR